MTRQGEVYRFLYRGAEIEVPIAPDMYALRIAVRERVIPGLESIKYLRQPAGLAFVRYHYWIDSLQVQSPEAVEELIQVLREAGLNPRPRRIDPISPYRHSLISYMRRNPEGGYLLKDFNGATFFLGPLRIEPYENRVLPPLLDVLDDIKASHFLHEHAIGFHGNMFLGDIELPEHRDRISNEEIVKALEDIFLPYVIL